MTPTATPAHPPPPAARRMTVDEYWEFCQRPENHNRLTELVRGEVIDVSRGNLLHGRLCSRVSYLLEAYAETAGNGYPAGNDTGVVLDEQAGTVVGPDVAYYLDEAETTADIAAKWGDRVPVLVVEVLSPSDRPGRVNAKVADYLAGGVAAVWVVDPDEATVTVYLPRHNLTVVPQTGSVTGPAVLPGLLVQVADIFRIPGRGRPQ